MSPQRPLEEQAGAPTQLIALTTKQGKQASSNGSLRYSGGSLSLLDSSHRVDREDTDIGDIGDIENILPFLPVQSSRGKMPEDDNRPTEVAERETAEAQKEKENASGKKEKPESGNKAVEKVVGAASGSDLLDPYAEEVIIRKKWAAARN